MTSTIRRVHPEQQPLRPAVALALISLLMGVMTLVGVALVYVLAATGFFENIEWEQDLVSGRDFATRIAVFTILGLALFAISAGMELASVILGILVVVKGDGKLRIGASLLLATALFGLFFSFSVDPSTFSDASGTLSTVVSVAQTVAEVARMGVTIAGLVILMLGIREVRRARSGFSRGPR